MLKWQSILLVVVVGYGTWAVADDQSPIRLSNSHLALRFDRRTGAWIGFADHRSGDELVIGPVSRTMILPPPIRRLDTQAIHQAVVLQKALDLDGDWLYTPTPPSPTAAARYVQGRFEEGKWEPTTIPSRRGTGDDRLHNRVGEFFYRREFICPAHWPDEEMALVIGAVDDFDSTYVNGTPIGATGVETPHHWETARIYRFPARLLHQGRPNTLLVKVTNAAYDGGIDGPVVVGPASALDAVEIGGSRLVDRAETREGQAAVLNMTISGRRVRIPPGVFPAGRAAVVCPPTDRAEREAPVRRFFRIFAFATPPLQVGPEQAVMFPGSLPVGDTPIASLQKPQWLHPRSHEPLAVLWDATKQRGLGTWYHCEEEYLAGHRASGRARAPRSGTCSRSSPD